MRWLISEFLLRKTNVVSCRPNVSTAVSAGVLLALIMGCIGISPQQAFQGEKKDQDTKLKLSVKEVFKTEAEPPFSNECLAMSSNGIIATGDLIGKVSLFDSVSGKKMKTLVVGEKGVRTIAFSVDNERIATSCEFEKGYRVFEVATGRELFFGSTKSYVKRLVFHPNGKELILAESAIQIRDAKTGELRRSHNTVALTGAMALSPDWNILAAGTFPFPITVMRVWNVKDFEEKFKAKQFAFKESIPDLCFSPCGKWLAGASDAKKAYIWDAKTGEVVHTIACAGKARSVAFSNDSKLLAIGISGDTMDISFRDTSNGEEVFVLKKLDPASHIAFDRKSNRFARCGGSTVQVWAVIMKKVDTNDKAK